MVHGPVTSFAALFSSTLSVLSNKNIRSYRFDDRNYPYIPSIAMQRSDSISRVILGPDRACVEVESVACAKYLVTCHCSKCSAVNAISPAHSTSHLRMYLMWTNALTGLHLSNYQIHQILSIDSILHYNRGKI
jgi:hypothetical protein